MENICKVYSCYRSELLDIKYLKRKTNIMEYWFGIFLMCIYFRCEMHVVASKRKTIVTLPDYLITHQVAAQPIEIPRRIVFEKVIMSLIDYL